MGVDGCGWMRWGTEGTGSTKTRQSGVNKGLKGQEFGPMTGEISPDIMFWEFRPKVSRMGADGCRWVRMGVDECISKGESKNKAKRGVNSRSGHVFECLHRAEKFRKSARMVMVNLRGPWEE